MKKLLLELFCTKLGLLIVSMFLIVVFGIISNFYDWGYAGMLISLAYPVGLVFVMMVYAYIINPIKEFRQRKKW